MDDFDFVLNEPPCPHCLLKGLHPDSLPPPPGGKFIIVWVIETVVDIYKSANCDLSYRQLDLQVK